MQNGLQTCPKRVIKTTLADTDKKPTDSSEESDDADSKSAKKKKTQSP